jgi:hypothetical protein
MFPVYVRKCLCSKGRSKVADDARPGEEAVEATIKDFFRRNSKELREVYQCWGGHVGEEMFSQSPISHVLRFASICDLFTDSPS